MSAVDEIRAAVEAAQPEGAVTTGPSPAVDRPPLPPEDRPPADVPPTHLRIASLPPVEHPSEANGAKRRGRKPLPRDAQGNIIRDGTSPPPSTRPGASLRAVVEEDEETREDRWANYLYRDFNPTLVSGVQMLAAIPDEWMDGPVAAIPKPDGSGVITLWEPALRTQLSLTRSQCHTIAKAGDKFAESPMGQALSAWLEANGQWIALLMALGVAGMYGWKVMAIRGQVGQLKVALEQLQTAQPTNGTAPAQVA